MLFERDPLIICEQEKISWMSGDQLPIKRIWMYIHSVKNKQYRCYIYNIPEFQAVDGFLYSQCAALCWFSLLLWVKNQFFFWMSCIERLDKNLHFFFKELNNAQIVCWVRGTRSTINCLIPDAGQYLHTLPNNFVKVEEEYFLYFWQSTRFERRLNVVYFA